MPASLTQNFLVNCQYTISLVPRGGCSIQAKTPLDSAIPSPVSVYSRTCNLAVVSVLVVLTWSQAAPGGPLLYLEAIKVPPLSFTRKPWRLLPSSWKQSPPLCSHGEPTPAPSCAIVGSHTGAQPGTLNGGLHCLITTHTHTHFCSQLNKST